MSCVFDSQNLTLFILSSGGSFCVIHSIGHLIQRKRNYLNYIISAIWLITGILLLLLLKETIELQNYEQLVLTDVFEPSLNFLLGPLLFFYFRHIIKNETAIGKSVLLHFIPAVASIIVLLPIFILHYSAENSLHAFSRSALTRIPNLVYALSSISMLVYLFVCLKICLKILLMIRKGRNRIIYFAALFLIELTVIGVMLLCAIILKRLSLFQFAGIITIQLMLALYMTGRRYPEFENDLIIEYSKAKYEKSKIKGLDVDAILKRLHDIMEMEKAYLDDELTLPVLSSMLGISRQQLSQILNERIGKSYSAYINGFRLQYAEKLLIQNRDMSILRIAFQAGFNSKSSFNNQFKRTIGVAPTEYRDKHLGMIPQRPGY